MFCRFFRCSQKKQATSPSQSSAAATSASARSANTPDSFVMLSKAISAWCTTLDKTPLGNRLGNVSTGWRADHGIAVEVSVLEGQLDASQQEKLREQIIASMPKCVLDYQQAHPTLLSLDIQFVSQTEKIELRSRK